MPNSFSRMATRSPYLATARTKALGNVRSGVISISRGACFLSPRDIQVLFFAQVSVHDAFVALNFVRSTFGNLFAKVQDGDAVGDIHHHAHVMLDQDAGDLPFLVLVDVENETRHIFD